MRRNLDLKNINSMNDFVLTMMEESNIDTNKLTIRLHEWGGKSLSAAVVTLRNVLGGKNKPSLTTLKELADALEYDIVFVPKENRKK